MVLIAIVIMSVFSISMGEAAEHRETKVSLNNDPNVHVPNWAQPKNAGNFSMGCGPIAWAIVYGYWKQNKGKNQLFEGNVIDTSSVGDSATPVKKAMAEIANHVSTYYRENFNYEVDYSILNGTQDVKRPGGTSPNDMLKGIKYAQEHGYPYSRVWRITGSEFDKFEHIKRYLLSDRPIIIRYDTEGHGATTNHYAVIEGAIKREELVGDSWKDRDVIYYINNGHGSHEWITARQVGVNTNQTHTVKDIFLITVSETPLPEASDVNEEACKEWCQQNQDECSMCSHLSECGAGYKTIKDFREAGKNWHACQKRDTKRSDASESNRLACERWCRSHNDTCVKCDTSVGCGAGYNSLKSWTGYGNNWYACAKNKPSKRDEASEDNFKKCKAWCDSHNDTCIQCTERLGCGPDMKVLESWTGYGNNWYACGLDDRQIASQANQKACKDFCYEYGNGCVCSTKANCGPGMESIEHWTGEGTNWHACVDKSVDDRAIASQINKKACMDYCATHNCVCKEWHGCGVGKECIKHWTGEGDNWHACADR